MPELTALNTGVVAISVDPPDVSARLHAALRLPFPLASDPDHVALELLGVFDPANEIAWPSMFLIERDRTVSWRSLATTYKERPTTDEVLAAIAAIAAR